MNKHTRLTLERDGYGRVIRRGIAVNGAVKVSDRYKWNKSNQLQSIVSDLTRHRVDFKYDQWDNLVSGTYNTANEIKTIYKTPDMVEGRTLRNSPVDYFSDGAR